MFGHQIISLCDRIIELGLADSREAFSIRYCDRARGYLSDYTRREGATARVSPRTIARIRHRLAEVVAIRQDLAAEIRDLDATIERDIYIATLLGRRSR